MPIGYFTDSTPLTPLQNPFNVLVDGYNNLEEVVDGFTETRALKTYRWPNEAARNAETGMQAGDRGYQEDTASDYIYTGSLWRSASSAFCTLGLSSNQALGASGTYVPVSWSYEIADPFNMHTSDSPTRITVPVSGVYEVVGQLYVNETTGSAAGVRLRANGNTEVRGSWTRVQPSAGPGAALQVATSAVLNAGNYLEVMVAPANSGSNLLGGDNNQSAVVTVKYIGPV